MDVSTLCLGALVMGDATGYEIRKVFEDGPFSHFHAANYGSIYPALTKLLRKGLVRCTEMPQAGRPDKKVYALTEAGRDAFFQALAKPLSPDRRRSEYLVALYFGHLLEAGLASRILDDYLKNYKDRLAAMEAFDPENLPPGPLFAFGFGKAVYETIVGYIEANRGLLEGKKGKGA